MIVLDRGLKFREELTLTYFESSTTRFIIATTCATLAFSCKPSNTSQTSRSGYILGPSSDIEVFSAQKQTQSEKFEKIKWDIDKLANSIPIVVTTHKENETKKSYAQFCSSSLITDPLTDKTLVLTNFHCLAEQIPDPKDSTKSIYTDKLSESACTETRIAFGHTEDADPTRIVKCLAGSARGSYEGDIMVFELEEELDDSYLRLNLSTNSKATNSANVAIHYPDIDGHRKLVKEMRADLPVQSITLQNCNLTTRFPSDQWSLDSTLFASFRSTCDIEHGSSGSALVDVETMEINGLNWGGIEIRFDKRVDTYNAATSPDYIKAFLEGKEDEYKTIGKSSDAIAESSEKGSQLDKTLKGTNSKPKTCGVTARSPSSQR